MEKTEETLGKQLISSNKRQCSQEGEASTTTKKSRIRKISQKFEIIAKIKS